MSHSLYIAIELVCLSPIEQHKEQGVCMQIRIKGHTNQEKARIYKSTSIELLDLIKFPLQKLTSTSLITEIFTDRINNINSLSLVGVQTPTFPFPFSLLESLNLVKVMFSCIHFAPVAGEFWCTCTLRWSGASTALFPGCHSPFRNLQRCPCVDWNSSNTAYVAEGSRLESVTCSEGNMRLQRSELFCT